MTTTEPGPILRAMIQAAGHEVPATLADVLADPDTRVEWGEPQPRMLGHMSDLVKYATVDDHAEHLLVHEKTYAMLRQAAGLEREQHIEYRPRRKLTLWWEAIWFALLRILLCWTEKHYRTVDKDGWWDTIDTLNDLSGIRPVRQVPITVFDETEEEYIARLKKRALEGPIVGRKIETSPYVTPGTVYGFNPEALNLDPLQASPIVFHEPPTPFEHSDAFQSAMADIRSAVAGGPFPARPHDQLLQPTSYAGIRVDPDA